MKNSFTIRAFLSSLSIAFMLCMTFSAFGAQGDCFADFSYEEYQGPLPVSGAVKFKNLSEGEYEFLSWDFGDGTFSSSANEEIQHIYADEGYYEVCLTVWDNGTCYSQSCQTFFVSLNGYACTSDDCVWPGDADKDGEANLYDLLYIGMAYGTSGPARPNATMDWNPQAAPDWDQETPDGINFKHLDCDGNGIIDEYDLDAIHSNYQAMNDVPTSAEDNGPEIQLVFDQNFIVLDQNTPDELTLTAQLVVGDPDDQIYNVHGLALYAGYDTTFVKQGSVTSHYHDGSFMGASDENIMVVSDIRESSQMDVGLSRINQIGTHGSGSIGEIQMTIIIDLIDGRAAQAADQQVALEFPITDAKVMGADGQEIPVSLPDSIATVIFSKNDVISSTTELLEEQITLYPNPSTGLVMVDLGTVEASELEVVNLLGQRVYRQSWDGNNRSIMMPNVDNGVYSVRFLTKEGWINQSIVIQK